MIELMRMRMKKKIAGRLTGCFFRHHRCRKSHRQSAPVALNEDADMGEPWVPHGDGADDCRFFTRSVRICLAICGVSVATELARTTTPVGSPRIRPM